jgi:hypothetical protein
MAADLEGVELRDLDAAAREATETIVQMAGDYRVAGGSREINIEVRDSGGRRLLTAALALRLVRDPGGPVGRQSLRTEILASSARVIVRLAVIFHQHPP